MNTILIILWVSIALAIFLESSAKWYHRRKGLNKIKVIIGNVIEAVVWPLTVIVNMLNLLKDKIFN